MTNTEMIRRLVASDLCKRVHLLVTAILASGFTELRGAVPDVPEKLIPDQVRRELLTAVSFVGQTYTMKRKEDSKTLLEQFIEYLDQIGL